MTIAEIQESIGAEVASLNDWFEIYDYLIAQARRCPPMDERFKTRDNALAGCQSEVWIHAHAVDGRLRLAADSTSLITKGILALVLRVLDGQPPAAVAEADLVIIDRLGLSTNLSPTRAIGVAGIVQRVKELGRQYAK